MRRIILATVFAALTASGLVPAQQAGTMTAEQMEHRRELEGELQSLAIVDRKVMMPMRDGVRLATDIYRPKNVTGKVPTIVVKTPYNFNYWDVRNRVPADMTAILTAIKRGTRLSARTSADISSRKATTTSSGRRPRTATT